MNQQRVSKVWPVLILIAILFALPLGPTAWSAPAEKSLAQTAAAWDGNMHPYRVGDLVSYLGNIYRCIQAHTSLSTWNPAVVPALWGLVGPGGGATNTPTRTNTPGGPTATRTRTNTPGGPTVTLTRTPTRTNTPSGPTATFTRTPTRTLTATQAPTVTPCASCALPRHAMIGYWHNFDNGVGFIRLRNVSTRWDVINVSFGEPTNGTAGGTIGFTPCTNKSPFPAGCGAQAYDNAQQFIDDVAFLRSQGKKVLISIGGANGQVQLTSTGARDNFVNSVSNIISTNGFDGLDIDFEGHSLFLNPGDTDFRSPTTPVVVNTIAAIRSIRSRFGANFMLTMAPETFFVQLGYQFYGGSCAACDTRAGDYLPVIFGVRDILTWLQVQDYNSGPIMGLDNNFYNMGNPDFHSAMLDMLLTGFPVAKNTALMFPALRPDQVVLGIPSAPNAGNGHMPPAEVQKALNYIIRGQTYGGAYVKRSANAAAFRGVMTWSINWDVFNNSDFSNSFRTYLTGLP